MGLMNLNWNCPEGGEHIQGAVSVQTGKKRITRLPVCTKGCGMYLSLLGWRKLKPRWKVIREGRK